MAAALPPAQPTAILRGHRAQVHAAVFVRTTTSSGSGAPGLTADSRLATGDSEGFVVLWDLAILRPRAVWRAHQNSILGVAGWDADGQIVTHGRDHKLIVWQVAAADEARLSTELPLDGKRGTTADDDRPRPWMVHVLEVNTMNFCAFAWCGFAGAAAAVSVAQPASIGSSSPLERLVAVPNTLSLESIDLYHLPSQRRVNTVKLGAKEGMVMALALFYASAAADALVLIAAFENGVVVVASLDGGVDGPATMRYRAQSHTQPILSLDVAPDHSYFLTSAADAVIAKHPIPVPARALASLGRGAPLPETSSMREEASSSSSPPPPLPPPSAQPMSLLSAALAKEAASSTSKPAYVPARPAPPPEPETQPLKIINTKHAGQQGLRIRSDGRLFATAGWDARVRVYAAATMKEVAVLKWHQTGCFAVAFAPVAEGSKDQAAEPTTTTTTETSLMRNQTTREVSVKERRLRHAVAAHWLAAGSKDGKISLWDIF